MVHRTVVLVVDFARPDRVLVRGKVATLKAIEFKLIAALAKCPAECVWYDDLYRELWGNRIVEEGQLYCHKSHLCKALDRAHPGGGGIIRTLARYGYMIDLPPYAVELKTARRLTPPGR